MWAIYSPENFPKRDEDQTSNKCERGKPKERAGVATSLLLKETDNARSKETAAGTDCTDERYSSGGRLSFEEHRRQAPE